jgi:chromosome segregation protein
LRLSQIKLAGFKSFVDPTHIHLPGQIVGVVGPNGCGKSNVIDALRWVLGESKASALRGESMQDVIFNGSLKRKPVSRASVELVFDNQLGKAAGQWSSYAEISIGRVLQRNGDSSYLINGQKVRRRDVTDIFLGTGLGARAYAIVEQGMISRIIEAKPEELRVFLEEAAGVSKYRDRRRETSQRLNDTRDNLQRVGDILLELDKQLLHLGEQAEVAQRYRALEKQRDTTQQLLWLIKKRDADVLRNGFAGNIVKTRNELEAQTAQLRDIESRLETLRSGHHQLSDELQARQGELYKVNAEISGLEQQIRHVAMQRQRLAQQIDAATQLTQQQRSQQQQATELLQYWRDQQEIALCRLHEAGQNAQREEAGLPQAEQAARMALDCYNGLQREQMNMQQQLQLFRTQHDNLLRNIGQLESRRARLLQESENLPRPDSFARDQAQEELAELDMKQQAFEENLEHLQDQLPQAEAARQQLRAALQQHERQAAKADAALHALLQLQKQLDGDKNLKHWLQQKKLDELPRLWQSIRIAHGWENALEAVLRERLNALPALADAAVWQDAPPARVALYEPASPDTLSSDENPGRLTPLLSYVQCQNGQVLPAVREWLASIYAVQDVAQGFELRDALPEGGWFVTQEGHLVGRHSVLLHAPNTQGVLTRQREIEQLEHDANEHRLCVAAAQQQLTEAEQHYRAIEVQIPPQRVAVNESKLRQHALQMQLLRLDQAHQHSAERRMQIAMQMQEISELLVVEQEQQLEIAGQMESLSGKFADMQVDEAKQRAREQEEALREQRLRVQQVQHARQEADFFSRTCLDKITDLQLNIQGAVSALAQAEQNMQQLNAELSECSSDAAALSLQTALQVRHDVELALGAARGRLESVSGEMRALDEMRLSCEHSLGTLREQLGEYALKEQEARLYFEQWAAQLQGADESALLPLLAGTRPNQMQNELTQLGRAIDGLGAVNLAALDELQAASERKNYLEAQAQDLNEAMATLIDAIKHIDRESRDLLMATFNQVNLQLAELFPVLFAGGEARLVLTGEEILDSGVQVMAQPPGKKNSSIHLLSGGEKALTAIALIFSLFQLNPAPFCLLDEVDAPLDDTNTERLCALVRKMALHTQFVFISHNKIAMEMAHQLIGVTMQEKGVSKVVSVDIEAALRMVDDTPGAI